jgi:hypothetical protein
MDIPLRDGKKSKTEMKSVAAMIFGMKPPFLR